MQKGSNGNQFRYLNYRIFLKYNSADPGLLLYSLVVDLPTLPVIPITCVHLIALSSNVQFYEGFKLSQLAGIAETCQALLIFFSDAQSSRKSSCGYLSEKSF